MNRQGADGGTYNALAPKQTPGQHVNGALTIGENAPGRQAARAHGR